MKTISQFLDHSQRAIYSVSPDDTVREALEVMGLISIGDVVREMIAYQK
jgi:CBS domain-containing protein